jgi:dipeptidyl-peptidase-4
LQDNAGLRKRLENYSLSQKEFFYLETEAGISLSAWMIKPTDFDESKQYPVLMHVYGGPGAQTVENSYDAFNDFWYQTLADQGYIIVSVDNRGTGARGRDFKKVTYKELGKYEVEDQIAAAVYLGKLPYVDASRIGIWGWSYGGYMSSLCITKGADVFKTAIAVAPVTNWRFYDSVYTERYMQTPQENASGYDENSPITHVKLLKGNYVLVHGSADDNVHVQNTMRLIEAMVQANVQFDLFIYPDKNHGIYGGNTRYHLYEKMTNYVLENL